MNSAPIYSKMLAVSEAIQAAVTHIDGKFAAYPDQLGGVLLQLDYTARVWLANVHSISAQIVDDLEVILEHVGVLVVLVVDVAANDGGKGQLRALPKGERYVFAMHGLTKKVNSMLQYSPGHITGRRLALGGCVALRGSSRRNNQS